MKPKVIKTESEYQATLARIDRLMDAERNTPKGDELELLALLIHEYEEEAFPIDKPDPLTALRFRMEQQGLQPKDLVPLLGSRSHQKTKPSCEGNSSQEGLSHSQALSLA